MVHRQVHLLVLHQRLAQRLDLVDRRLSGGDAVLREEQAFTPQQGLAAEPERDGDAGHVEPVAHVGGAEFGRSSQQPACVGGKLVRRCAYRVEGGGVVVCVWLVVGRIVPAIRADLGAKISSRDVEHGAVVHALGYDAAAERAVAVVGVRVLQQGRVLAVDTQPEREAHGGVQPDVEAADGAEVGRL